MAITPKLMTANELFDLPDDGLRHELVRGELRTTSPGGIEHGDESSILDGSIGPCVRARKLGRVFVGETGFVLETDPDTVRASDIVFVTRERLAGSRASFSLSRCMTDIAFVTRERLAESGIPRGYYRGAPDLAVEVISPNDRYTEVAEKIAQWLEHGTRMVVVVDPRRRTVDVHRPGQPTRTLGVNDVLDGEDVVPGWCLPVRDLFDQP